MDINIMLAMFVLMIKEAKCILLIDDDKISNFYNSKIVKKQLGVEKSITANSGQKALDYLNEAILGLKTKPNLIFLDLNMPAMNGWEFLEKYEKLDADFTKDIKLIILTTSNNPDDFERSKKNNSVDDYINKPLSDVLLDDLLAIHYKKNA